MKVNKLREQLSDERSSLAVAWRYFSVSDSCRILSSSSSSAFCCLQSQAQSHQSSPWAAVQAFRSPSSPVQLLLLPTGQLHGDAQLLVVAGRHAEVSRQRRLRHSAVGQQGVPGVLQGGDGGGPAGVRPVLRLSAGQRDGQRLLDGPEDGEERVTGGMQTEGVRKTLP